MRDYAKVGPRMCHKGVNWLVRGYDRIERFWPVALQSASRTLRQTRVGLTPGRSGAAPGVSTDNDERARSASRGT